MVLKIYEVKSGRINRELKGIVVMSEDFALIVSKYILLTQKYGSFKGIVTCNPVNIHCVVAFERPPVATKPHNTTLF